MVYFFEKNNSKFVVIFKMVEATNSNFFVLILAFGGKSISKFKRVVFLYGFKFE